MKTTYSQQIKAIQKARALLSHTDRKELDACLNDAGSTIAALNLTKELPVKFYVGYSNDNEEFEVYEITERWESGGVKTANRIAFCSEESDANQIVNALNKKPC